MLKSSKNITVTTTGVASGGAIAEDSESIRNYAPLLNQTRGRAFTEDDYKVILKQAYPEIQAINVFGGENMKHITNYKPKEFAELLNVSVKTLQRWDRDKVLIAKRTPTDRRFYTEEQLQQYLKKSDKNDESL